MAVTGYPFPYDVDNLLGGAVRILYAPTSVAIPVTIKDVIDMQSPYHAQTGWLDLGATKESFTYSRSFDTSGLEIQQSSGALFEEITSLTRTMEVSVAELNVAHLKLIEGAASATGTVAAVANASAQKTIAFGEIESLDTYRFAFISRRNIASGIVTEDSALTRGRFVMGVAYKAQLSANESQIEQAKGALTAASLSFKLFPDSSVGTAADSWGCWFTEDTGTIA